MRKGKITRHMSQAPTAAAAAWARLALQTSLEPRMLLLVRLRNSDPAVEISKYRNRSCCQSHSTVMRRRVTREGSVLEYIRTRMQAILISIKEIER